MHKICEDYLYVSVNIYHQKAQFSGFLKRLKSEFKGQIVYRPALHTGCRSQIRKIFEFKIWKEPMHALHALLSYRHFQVFQIKAEIKGFLLVYRLFQYKHWFLPNFELKDFPDLTSTPKVF